MKICWPEYSFVQVIITTLHATLFQPFVKESDILQDTANKISQGLASFVEKLHSSIYGFVIIINLAFKKIIFYFV